MKKVIFIVFSLILVVFLNITSYACLGEKFVISSDGSLTQEIIGEMMRVYVEERTGILSVVKIFKTQDEIYREAKQKKTDFFIDIVPVAGADLDQLKAKYEKEWDYTTFNPYGAIKKDNIDHYLVPVVRKGFLRDGRETSKIFYNFLNIKLDNKFFNDFESIAKNKIMIKEKVFAFLSKENLL